ncbi:protein NYNRIN-like [Gossypium australe]|uniref:Protein NYNRIN-like n=1 Tax=Gossypium australe TaxID=47621 RepID=A0A5B6X1P0_9ROSI|nr:protein NYNRIN-like [Gossypium australe]
MRNFKTNGQPEQTGLGERKVLGLDPVKDSEGKIRLIQDRSKAASDRQKSYLDLRRKDIEYSMGD